MRSQPYRQDSRKASARSARHNAGARGPDRENHRQARHFDPLAAEIVGVIWKTRGIDAQGGIADDECGVGRLQHGVKIRRLADEFRLRAVFPRENHARQFNGSARAGICGKRANLRRGARRDEQDAAHWAAAGDAGAGNGFEMLAGELERRHDADIGCAGSQMVRADGGDGKFQVEQIALRTMKHSPDEGSGVEVADRAHAGPVEVSIVATQQCKL